nr:DUF554 domain-containing protein [bacterium]
MLGTVVNVAAVLVGGGVGLVLKKGLPKRLADTLMKGLGLCTLYIGLTGAMKGQNTLIIILSMVVGALIGEGIDLDDKLNRLGAWVEKKCSRGGQSGAQVPISQGFVTASLLFCVGAMAIVGSLQSGLTGDHQMIYTKSMLDGVAAMIFASSLGLGVLLSAVSVLVYQGSIVLLAQAIAPYLGDAVVAEMTCVGSLIIIGLALNMLGITKLKVMNYVPAIFLPILLCVWMG